MNIELTKQANERDTAIANTISKQIPMMTMLGNGFTKYAPIPKGAEFEFRLSRPYGHRSIFITLNSMDMYDVKTVRFGRNFKEYVVAEHSNIFAENLSEIIWQDIATSCER